MKKRLKIGEILLKRGLVTKENLKEALFLQEEEKEKVLGEILTSRGFLDKAKLQEALSFQRREVPVVTLSQIKLSPSVVKIVPEDIARHLSLIAIKKENHFLTVATANPTDIIPFDIVENSTGLKLKPVKSSQEEILQAINEYYREFPDLENNSKEPSLAEVKKDKKDKNEKREKIKDR